MQSTVVPFRRVEADPRTESNRSELANAAVLEFPIVAQRTARRDGFGLAAGAAIALALGVLTFATMHGGRETRSADNREPAAVRVPIPAQSPTSRTEKTAAPPFAAPATAPAQLPASHPSTDPAHSPVMVFDASGATPAATPPQASSGAKIAKENGGDIFASGLTSSESANASPMANPSTTIVQGTMVPAVLETAIDSDLPGYARAVVTRDIRSFDGSRLLVPRSSRLIGQYKSGLTAGQKRIYVMWTRLIRPDGVSVAIASPDTDFSGRSGLSGSVDGHFFQRFGSAMVMTVLGGLAGGSSLVLSGQSAASVAADRDSQRPPTIRVPIGQPIRVFISRDLDFSAVTTELAQ